MSGMPNNSFEPTLGRPRRNTRFLFSMGLVASIPIVFALFKAVDREALATTWRAMGDRPGGLALSVAFFALAFVLRSFAWRKVLADLTVGQALAAIHVALAGNHVLPLRLGEPLRVVSVVRRTNIDWRRATASVVTLRSGDIVAIVALGALTGIGTWGAGLALWAVGILAAAGAGVGVAWLLRLRSSGDLELPGPAVLVATAGAWLAESVVIWQAASWSGINLSPSEAVMVTAAAVVAQVLAVAPGGFGTYEAGGTGALVLLGYEPAAALAAVLTAHAVKTAYSLIAGGVASFAPAPSIFGRFRLHRPVPPLDAPLPPSPEGPVVLFMPAYNEVESVAATVARVPARVCDREVVCLVVDDGSTDGTALEAEQAGARVISLGSNHGLGAAVRLGLSEAARMGASAVAFCDADGEYAPEELGNLVGPVLRGEADYVVGSRFDGEILRMLPHRRFGNRVLTVVLSWVARRRISDGQSGYRAFSPRAASAAEIIHDFNYAQVITLDLLAKGMRYLEVPISYSFRTRGQSFVRLGKYLRAVTPAVYRELQSSTT